MKLKYSANLEQVLYETAIELSNISPITEPNKHLLVEEFLRIFNMHYKLIEYIKSDVDEMVEIKKIKKEKKYLKTYISAFEKNQKLYEIIKDETNRDKMILNILLFESFMEDIESFSKTQSAIYTFFLSNPENRENYKKIKSSTRELRDFEKNFLITYERYKYLKSLLIFFRCHSITEKNIMTSLSITLYKILMKTNAISKYQIKEILETMFFKLDAPTTIRVDEMDKTYIKTVVDKLIILAYPSSNDIESLLNFDEINKKLLEKLEKYKDNPSKKEKYENYINTRISPLQDKLSQ